ncbi:hypothetical protein, partial [Nocardiopsis alba]|uniref:hypothetical protein n=1 Tax=Nocardiopsis alba TaxID=53437 RepID=UPI00366DF88F
GGVDVAAAGSGEEAARVGEQSADAGGDLAAGQGLDVDAAESQVRFGGFPARFFAEERDGDFPASPPVVRRQEDMRSSMTPIGRSAAASAA